MNSCFGNNSCLWLLIAALVLGTVGTNLLNSRALTGCGWPFLAALLYCTCKNGTLSRLADSLGLGGCGCKN
ncbi:MAG: hypothetical protein IKD43_02825 [Clostridia bacterium]|nr:hypothetical protein [Clostridia bacterium]